MEEFIRNITEQIRCVRAREAVARELSDHILDQAAAYEEQGEEHETAVSRAVHEMGDPVEIGVELDRIHRPQTDVKLIVMVLLFSIGGMLLQYILGGYAPMDGQNGASVYLTQFGRQSLILLVSFGVMAGMYFLDYSFIGRYAWAVYWGMTFVFFILKIVGREVNGRHPAMLMLVYLYIPVYAGILYRLRGKGFGAVIKGIGMQFLTAAFANFFSNILHAACAVYMIQMVLLLLAVCRGWFQVNKRDAVIAVVTVSVIAPLAVGLLVMVREPAHGSFRMERIRAFLQAMVDPQAELNQSGYIYGWIREALSQSKLVGACEEILFADEIVWMVPRTDPFILLETVLLFGILAGLLVVAAFAALIVHAFRIVRRQKNQLGFMVSAACFLVFLDNCVEGILINSGFYPVTSLQFPFLSSGVGATITYAVMIGLLLSIYRNEKIVTDYTVAGRPVWRLRVRLEKKEY